MEKEALIQQLNQAREKLSTILKQVDPQSELIPNWTIKDMLAHISAWDEVCVDSLRVLAAGGEPRVTVHQSIDAFNDDATAAYRELNYDDVLQKLEANRAQFTAIINALPEKMLTTEFTLPWGGQGTVKGIVIILAEHEEEHVEEIEALLR